jgi:hypothetical protein
MQPPARREIEQMMPAPGWYAAYESVAPDDYDYLPLVGWALVRVQGEEEGEWGRAVVGLVADGECVVDFVDELGNFAHYAYAPEGPDGPAG